MMNWGSKSGGGRAAPSYLDFDAGPPLPPRNQLSSARTLRLSDSADLLYEVPQEFSNQRNRKSSGVNGPAPFHHRQSTGGVPHQPPPVATTQYDHPVYATVQRKSYRYHGPDDLTRSDSFNTPGWNQFTGGGSYATMSWKRVPPPKPPRKVMAPMNRSLSQQQYHSKSQHQLHVRSSDRAQGLDYLPAGSAGESATSASSAGSDRVVSGSDMKRSASNDGDGLYSELKITTNAGPGRFSTFLGGAAQDDDIRPHYDQLLLLQQEHLRQQQQQHAQQDPYSSLYDEIANGSPPPPSSTVAQHPRSAPSLHAHGRSQSMAQQDLLPATANNGTAACNSKSSLNRSKAPSLHQRSKSEHHPNPEHHPLCPNFHQHPPLPPRPPLPPKPISGTGTISRKTPRDANNGGEPPLPARNGQAKTNGLDRPDEPEDDLYPERPPSPETAVDGIRSVIKPLCKVRQHRQHHIPNILAQYAHCN